MERHAAMLNARGLTLVEIMIAALVGVVVAGGTMLAFTTAKKVSVGSSGTVEAADLAQQTIERFRNRIACDDPWFAAANCGIDPTALTDWTVDPDAGNIANGLPASPGSLSVIGQGGMRQYRVVAADCDGAPGDECLKVETKVNWQPRQ